MIHERKTLWVWKTEAGLDVLQNTPAPTAAALRSCCGAREMQSEHDDDPQDNARTQELHSATCSDCGAVHTVSRVTRQPVAPHCRLTPRSLGSARQFSPLPWRRLRFPGSNNASLSSQRCRGRCQPSAEAAPVADPDWAPEILSGKRAKPPRGHLQDAINLGMKMSAGCTGKKKKKKNAERRRRPRGAASVLPTCLAQHDGTTRVAHISRRFGVKAALINKPIVCSRGAMRVCAELKER